MRLKFWRLGNGHFMEELVSDDDVLYLPLHQLCGFLNLNPIEQRNYWLAHPRLRQGLLKYEMNGKFLDLVRYDMALLWLSNIKQPSPDQVQGLRRFQREVAAYLDMALYDHFFDQHPWLFDWLDDGQPIVEAYRSLLAQFSLVREQLVAELLGNVGDAEEL